MLWVRLPPELLDNTSSWSSGVLATLSRWRSWVRIPSGTLRRHGTQLAKRRSSNLRDFVGSTPIRATGTTCVGWALACPSGCNPPALGALQVQLLPGALTRLARSFRGRTPGSHPGEAGSIPARVTDITKWWNWQTHDAQNVVPRGVGVQVSPWLLTRVSQRSAEFHKLRPPGATPGPAT